MFRRRPPPPRPPIEAAALVDQFILHAADSYHDEYEAVFCTEWNDPELQDIANDFTIIMREFEHQASRTGAKLTDVQVVQLKGLAERLRAYRTPREQSLKELFKFPAADVLGMPVPDALRQMHKNPNLSEVRNFTVVGASSSAARPQRWDVRSFLPLSTESLIDFDTEALPGCFPIAEDQRGNPYSISLKTELGDPPVFHFDYDGDRNTLVSPSLSEFLAWPRQPTKGKPQEEEAVRWGCVIWSILIFAFVAFLIMGYKSQ